MFSADMWRSALVSRTSSTFSRGEVTFKPALRRSCRPSTALYPAHLGYDAPPLWRRPARLSTLADRIRARLVCMLLAALAVSGCVYQMDIQQGNLLEEETIAQVEVGM